VNYIKRQQLIEEGVEVYYDSIGIPPGCPTMKGYSGDPYTTGTAITTAITTDTEVPSGWPQEIVYAPAGGPPGAPIQYGDTITNETADAGFGYIGTGALEETQRYFFHSDHLGSTSYVTDVSGNINQYVAYLPFGETFVEGHSDWDSPYKFNAKEYDSETGLYYYGARYYDPKTSLWIGVDPMAEKYTNYSPFAYCLNNPIKLIDPRGKEPGNPRTRAVLATFNAIEVASKAKTKMTTSELSPSAEGLAMTISYEALSLSMYDLDGAPQGNATIGFGHKIHSGAIDGRSSESEYKNGITLDKAIDLLASDVDNINTTLSNRVDNKGLSSNITQNEYDVAFDLEYNTGNSGKYLNKLKDIKKLEANGNTVKADKKRGQLTNWLSKQFPGKESRRGTSRAVLNEGSYTVKQNVLDEIEVKNKKK